MMDSNERGILGYFIVALGGLAFVMLYIWQSVEVTKIRLDYKKLLKIQEQLVKEHDKFTYDIEMIRAGIVNNKEAEKRGMRRMVPSDYERIEVK